MIMDGKFDIIEYMSGLTSFTFDKAVLQRIALERGVSEVTEYAELDQKSKDLIFADLLFAAYFSPNVWSSITLTHTGFSKGIGSQTIYLEEKERLYNMFTNIYKKWEDDKLNVIPESNLQWMY